MVSKEIYAKAKEIGLSNEQLTKINAVFASFKKIEQVWLYGSRAKGNFDTYSDIDITLKGAELDLNQKYQLDEALDDLYLPYKFDISIQSQINNPDLLAHIERVGILLYQKNP
jgi:predicted nucleotidyltransferase